MKRYIQLALGLIAVLLIVWVGYEFGVKGTLTIQTDDATPNVSITAHGKLVYDGQQKSVRLNPGSYTVTVTSGQKGVSKHIDIAPFSNATVSVSPATLLHTSLIAPAALYQAFPSGDSYIGFDPANTWVKRVDSHGVVTKNLIPLFTDEDAEGSLPAAALDYQPYQHNQAIVASDGSLYVVGNNDIKEINTDGIQKANAPTGSAFIIATQPGSQSAAFIVGFGRDVYLYENAGSEPKKIYTAKKDFNQLVFGGHVVGLYDTRIPPSKQDMRAIYGTHQNDLLLVDTAANNAETTVTGPLTSATLSPDGTLATVAPRNQQPYLYDVAKKQQLNDLELPLTAGPYWTSTTTFLFSKGGTVWQYDTSAKQGTLVAQVPMSVTAFYKDDSGAIIATGFSNPVNGGIYRLAPATAASTLADKLKSALPFRGESISITYTNVTTPVVTIQTTAPLNSASQLDRYRAQTAQLRQQALEYLISQGIDPKAVTIVYDPADPL